MRFHKLKAWFAAFILAFTAVGVSACTRKKQQVSVLDTQIERVAASATEIPYSTGVNALGDYDDSLFYQNDFSLFTTGADPTMLYHDGYFYQYNTSGGQPMACHRTKNFAEWEYMGTAYDFTKTYNAGKSWARGLFWAPELFEWNGKFYMYVTANNTRDPSSYPEGLEFIGEDVRDNNLSDTQLQNKYGINAVQDLIQTIVLVSDKPEGPFEPYEGDRTIQKYFHGEKVGRPTVEHVDGHTTPFFDFANAPEAWETNKFYFDETVDRETYEKGAGKKVYWNANVFSNLDAASFTDEDGTLYMYVVRSGDAFGYGYEKGRSQTIWGCRMFDPVTPDYSTFTQLTQPRRLTVGGEYTYGDATTEGTMDGGIGEGVFVLHHTTYEGGKAVKKYYLTYSTGKKATGNNWGYNIAVAVGDSPLGPFEKIPEKYGNPIYMVSPEYGNLPTSSWTHGSGHGTFFTAGDETFLIAHSTQVNHTVKIGNERQPIIDRMVWSYNEELGFDLPHMNGPSKNTLQPQPFTATGYRNIAPEATASATNLADGSSAADLNDDYRVIHQRDDNRLFRANMGGTTITLTFDAPRDIRAVMVYNSRDIQYAFSEIDYILLENGSDAKIIRNLAYPESGLVLDGGALFVTPGGAAVAEFAETKVTRISFKITKKFEDYEDEIIEGIEDDGTMYGICVSDIVVLGKGEGSDYTAPADFDERAYKGSRLVDLSNFDDEGNRIVRDRDLLDPSGNHGYPNFFTYDGNGGVKISATGISLPFKHESTATGGFTASITNKSTGNPSASWNNGAIMVYTGYGQTNLEFRIFVIKYSRTEMRVVFNHIGSPWAERYYPFEYDASIYANNGAEHTLTVAFLDGVYYIAFTAAGGPTRALRIDRDTPFLESDKLMGDGSRRSTDVSAMFVSEPKIIGLSTIDQGVYFSAVSYACSDAAARNAIGKMQAAVVGNTPQNGEIVLPNGNEYYVGERIPVSFRARSGYALESVLLNGVVVPVDDLEVHEEAGGIKRYVYWLEIAEAKAYSFFAAFKEA